MGGAWVVNTKKYIPASSGKWDDMVAASHTFGGTTVFSATYGTNQYTKGGSTKASPVIYLFFNNLDTPSAITGGLARISRKWPFAWSLLISGFSTWKL